MKNILIFFLIISLPTNSTYSLAQTTTREYQIKAAFLFNFSQFINWPLDAFPNAQSPIIIGILGKDPFGTYLDQIVSGEKANERPLLIQRYQTINDIKTCHILFINLTDPNKVAQIIADLKGRNILTVSDAPDFMVENGMIKFYTENNRIQFQVNPEAARSAELTISSKLLRLAKIYSPK